jgi:hypothetical protein
MRMQSAAEDRQTVLCSLDGCGRSREGDLLINLHDQMDASGPVLLRPLRKDIAT